MKKLTAVLAIVALVTVLAVAAFADNTWNFTQTNRSYSPNPSVVTTVSTTYNVATTDHMVKGDASSAGFTMTLPAISKNAPGGKSYIFKKIDTSTNAITINPSTIDSVTNTIEGQTTRKMVVPSGYLAITAVGYDWKVTYESAPIVSDMTNSTNYLYGTIASSGAVGPSSAGSTTLGTAALPYSGAYIGTAATNNIQLLGTATAARNATFPDASITVSGAVGQWCGATNGCTATSISSTMKVAVGSANLVSGSPSTVIVTGISPAFTSTSSYVCNVTYATGGATNGVMPRVSNTSTSSITITGQNSSTDTINYMCVGN